MAFSSSIVIIFIGVAAYAVTAGPVQGVSNMVQRDEYGSPVLADLLARYYEDRNTNQRVKRSDDPDDYGYFLSSEEVRRLLDAARIYLSQHPDSASDEQERDAVGRRKISGRIFNSPINSRVFVDSTHRPHRIDQNDYQDNHLPDQITAHGRLVKNLDQIDDEYYVRNLDHIGGGHLVRNLDQIGGGHLVRNLDQIDAENLARRAAYASNAVAKRRSLSALADQPVAVSRILASGARGAGSRNLDGHLLRQARRGLDSLSGATFGENKRYAPLRRLGAMNVRPGNFDEIDRSVFDRFSKRNIDEIDTAFDSFFKRNFDEIDRVGWGGFVKRFNNYLADRQQR